MSHEPVTAAVVQLVAGTTSKEPAASLSVNVASGSAAPATPVLLIVMVPVVAPPPDTVTVTVFELIVFPLCNALAALSTAPDTPALTVPRTVNSKEVCGSTVRLGHVTVFPDWEQTPPGAVIEVMV